MAAVKLLLGLLCLAFTGSIGLSGRNLLKKDLDDLQTARQRERLVNTARNELGVRELTGHNDGERVEAYLKVVNLKKGQPWCAAFISWVYAEQNYTMPRSGWTPALFPSSRVVRSALPGNLIGIYFPGLKRIAHVGMIEKTEGNWALSIEGNTDIQGSAEGDGVYRKRRHLKTIHRIADWIRPEKN